jgi:hypothetical protein
VADAVAHQLVDDHGGLRGRRVHRFSFTRVVICSRRGRIRDLRPVRVDSR